MDDGDRSTAMHRAAQITGATACATTTHRCGIEMRILTNRQRVTIPKDARTLQYTLRVKLSCKVV